MYHYAANNPVKYTDPDGRVANFIIFAWINYKFIIKPSSILAAQKGIFPNKIVGFVFDPAQKVYHATFDCWQSNWGYNDLYDVGFGLATSMEAAKFGFTSNGQDYILWGWKGNYLNMGAGCELGIYKKADGIKGWLGHYKVDENLAMKSKGSLFLEGLNGIQIGTFDSADYGNEEGKHWWATIFNPFQRNKKKDELTAQFNIIFPTRQLYEDFKAQRIGDSRLSDWNDKNNSVTITF